ncbi:MAG: phosphoesterase [Paenibacillus sp.]|nr:phosphoesterase [Paenibacillus sp.]
MVYWKKHASLPILILKAGLDMTSGRKRNGKRLVLAIAVAAVCLSGFIYWQNNHLVTTAIRYVHPGLPDSFDDFTIVHVSDLHNKSFGANQNRLVRATERASPDLIVITGDLIDSKRTDIDAAMNYIKQAAAMAPTYYVTGNHEKWSGVYAELSERLLGAGVVLMDDRRIELAKDGGTIDLLGLKDPAFTPSVNDRELERKLVALRPSPEPIGLSHAAAVPPAGEAPAVRKRRHRSGIRRTCPRRSIPDSVRRRPDRSRSRAVSPVYERPSHRGPHFDDRKPRAREQHHSGKTLESAGVGRRDAWKRGAGR